MSVYQSSDGRWIFFDGVDKRYFNTEREAVQMSSKQEYAKAVQAVATDYARVADRMADLHSVYFDRGYGEGGANEITDADLESLGITVVNLSGFIAVAEQTDKLLNSQATTPGDYDSTLNKLRTDV